MSEFYRKLADEIAARFGDALISCDVAGDEVTAVVRREHLLDVCRALRDEEAFGFAQLMDLCGVDYSEYGMGAWQGERFAAVYHLLSVTHNQRLRVRCFAEGDPAILPSVVDIWNSANWYEREAFDLYGIVFEGHPDLRRILTDYGFVGHPFRKDFPLIGHVEMRYDPERQRVVYQPVSIEPRVLVPRVIRRDHRYLEPEQAKGN
ncbi:NADH-quinone oxidoreductase subunit C [Ectothiorhodospiraceae bacterium 2226]|nr:NADH-quinone oxidoreductase subunit C [Ectothiorhodospiraceae bacterium 2226]